MLSHHKQVSMAMPRSVSSSGQKQPAQRAVAVKSISFRFFLILTFIIIGRPQDFLGFLAPLRLALLCTMLALAATAAGVLVVANPPHPELHVDLLLRRVPLGLALDAVAAQAGLRADLTAGGVVLRECKS